MSYLIHDPQHLQCEHVLSQVITVLDDEFDAASHLELVVHLLVLKLNPQRSLQIAMPTASVENQWVM